MFNYLLDKVPIVPLEFFDELGFFLIKNFVKFLGLHIGETRLLLSSILCEHHILIIVKKQ